VTDAPELPEWLTGTTRKDWLRDGYTITEEQWADLDWSRAWVDMGPSPAGNLGPTGMCRSGAERRCTGFIRGCRRNGAVS
jgi:hypothetical protein